MLVPNMTMTITIGVVWERFVSNNNNKVKSYNDHRASLTVQYDIIILYDMFPWVLDTNHMGKT